MGVKGETVGMNEESVMGDMKVYMQHMREYL